MSHKPYLALFRAGPKSLHPHCAERLAEQNFDYALSYFGDDEPPAAGAVFVHKQKGAKWPGLAATLQAHWDDISRYDYVWLPDDDLLCVPELVSRMFAICTDLGLELAQPALTPDSYYTHPITVQHKPFQLRFTNFVEIMAPVLSAEMLRKAMPTLSNNISGFGLDSLWPRLSRLGRVAIIDDTPVKHTRPVGGPNYVFNKQAGVSPRVEDWMTAAEHFIEQEFDVQINFAGLLQSGDTVIIGPHPKHLSQMLALLIESMSAIKIGSIQLTRYLSVHLNYVRGGDVHARYPRELLRMVLDRAHGGAGITFPKPPPKTAEEKARDPFAIDAPPRREPSPA